MADHISGCHLTFNGAILNYRELRSGMEEAGERFVTRGDTEVLLRMLVRKGTVALPDLDGMFAFAFHDPKRRRTVLARDGAGVKPLYWAKDGRGHVVFASEPKGILPALSGRPRADRDAMMEYLAFQVPVSDRTLFHGIQRLPPGYYLDIHSGGIHMRRWWEPPESEDSGEDSLERLRTAMRRSVSRCLRSDRPVGTFLSGGLDSTLVTALASEEGEGVLPAFHGAFDSGAAFDERAHARTAAKSLDIPLHEVVPTPEQVADALPDMARAMDEPMGGPGVIGSWFAAKEASRSVRVILGGQGADEVFSGYARHLAVEFAEALRHSVEGRSGPLLELLPTLGPLRGYEPLLSSMFRNGPAAPTAADRFFVTVHRGTGMDAVLRDDVSRELALYRPRERFEEVFDGGDAPLRTRMAEFERTTLLPALLHVEDRTTMAHGLEGRVPFLGREVLRVALATPASVRWAGGGLKPMLRAASEGLVPRSILDRQDKMGFPVPLAAWAKGPLRDFLGDVLLDRTARERGLTRPEEVERLLDGEGLTARRLWALLSLELWHRTFIDR
jgi:asparagine synthase (glutamine-hydrolysing)